MKVTNILIYLLNGALIFVLFTILLNVYRTQFRREVSPTTYSGPPWRLRRHGCFYPST